MYAASDYDTSLEIGVAFAFTWLQADDQDTYAGKDKRRKDNDSSESLNPLDFHGCCLVLHF